MEVSDFYFDFFVQALTLSAFSARGNAVE